MAIVLRGLAAAFMMAISAIASAHADSVADFYKGRTISVVVGGSAGGGYDALARLVARYLGKYVPGRPSVIVQDMPGAGGIVSMNYIANTAPQDGTVIGSPTANTPFEPLYGTSQALYDPMKLIWLGPPSPETSNLTIWNTFPFNSSADARTNVIRVGVTGANSTSAFYAKLLNETLGFQEQLILGFPGQNDAFIAMERGEIDGEPDAFYSSMGMATRPSWIPENKGEAVGADGGRAIEGNPRCSLRSRPRRQRRRSALHRGSLRADRNRAALCDGAWGSGGSGQSIAGRFIGGVPRSGAACRGRQGAIDRRRSEIGRGDRGDHSQNLCLAAGGRYPFAQFVEQMNNRDSLISACLARQ